MLFLIGSLIMVYNLWHDRARRRPRTEPRIRAPRRPPRAPEDKGGHELKWHEKIETNVILMIVLILITVSIGGLVEIVPLFIIESTIEKVEGVRPYSPLELAGRNIYIREGCYVCHSQMIRSVPRRGRALRPLQPGGGEHVRPSVPVGSKRTGPDLARVGGKYSERLARGALINPRSVVPESIMPGYPFLDGAAAGYRRHRRPSARQLRDGRRALHRRDDRGRARIWRKAQADPEADGIDALLERYPRAMVARFRRRSGAA